MSMRPGRSTAGREGGSAQGRGAAALRHRFTVLSRLGLLVARLGGSVRRHLGIALVRSSWANPMLMPPPHIFLQDFFARAGCSIQVDAIGDPPAWRDRAHRRRPRSPTRHCASSVRAALALRRSAWRLGMAIRYAPLLGRLILPAIYCWRRSPRSPGCRSRMLLFGIGNAPAIFLVVHRIVLHHDDSPRSA